MDSVRCAAVALLLRNRTLGAGAADGLGACEQEDGWVRAVQYTHQLVPAPHSQYTHQWMPVPHSPARTHQLVPTPPSHSQYTHQWVAATRLLVHVGRLR